MNFELAVEVLTRLLIVIARLPPLGNALTRGYIDDNATTWNTHSDPRITMRIKHNIYTASIIVFASSSLALLGHLSSHVRHAPARPRPHC